MIRPNKRWLTLSEVEQLLGGDPANRDSIVAGCLAGEISSRKGVEYGHKDLVPAAWKDGQIDWEKSTIRTWFAVAEDETLYSTYPVELDRLSFEKCFGLPHRENLNSIKTRVGGRPRKYDWEAFLIELATHVFENGLPEKQADLEGRMMQWCQDEWGDQPSDSEVRKRVSRLRRTIEARVKT